MCTADLGAAMPDNIYRHSTAEFLAARVVFVNRTPAPFLSCVRRMLASLRKTRSPTASLPPAFPHLDSSGAIGQLREFPAFKDDRARLGAGGRRRDRGGGALGVEACGHAENGAHPSAGTPKGLSPHAGARHRRQHGGLTARHPSAATPQPRLLPPRRIALHASRPWFCHGPPHRGP